MGFGKDLKEALEMQGVNVRTLAAWTGIPATTLYSAIKTDAEKTSLENMSKIASALNLPPDYFFTKKTKISTEEEYRSVLDSSGYYSHEEIEEKISDWKFEKGFREWRMKRKAPHKEIAAQIEVLNYDGLSEVLRLIRILSSHPDYVLDKTKDDEKSEADSNLPVYRRPPGRSTPKNND